MPLFYPLLRNLGVFVALWAVTSGVCSWARPATFLQDFRITWSDYHIKQIDQGRAIQLILDQNSGNFSNPLFVFYYISIYSTCNIDHGRKSIPLCYLFSGCGFASKKQYMFGRVSMKIKLIPGDSAGTVTAFYVSY